VVNLVVAVIVNSMHAVQEEEMKEQRDAERQIVQDETEALSSEIRGLRQELKEIKSLLGKR
jgi:HAMP domain-containing protein